MYVYSFQVLIKILLSLQNWCIRGLIPWHGTVTGVHLVLKICGIWMLKTQLMNKYQSFINIGTMLLKRLKSNNTLYIKIVTRFTVSFSRASKKTGKKVEAGVISVFARCYWTTFCMGGLMRLVQDLLPFISPEIMK